ncbi:MAG: 4Fe-4S binding protein [Candidatus Micrarchaeia archaeon]
MFRLNENRCMYCGSCVGVCPQLALVLDEVKIRHDAKRCIECGICMRACPLSAITVKKE